MGRPRKNQNVRKNTMAFCRLESLKPYDKNPRTISDDAVAAVEKSIKQFGFLQPILVDQSLRICAGHTRYLAAKKLAYKEVPVIQKTMTEQEFIAFNIADNKTHEFTSWNKKQLAANWELLGEQLQWATSLESWEVDFGEPQKPKDSKAGEQGSNENLLRIELIYDKDSAKELKEMCKSINPDLPVEDVIFESVKMRVDK